MCVDTVEAGFMTKDLALLVGPDQKWLTTDAEAPAFPNVAAIADAAESSKLAEGVRVAFPAFDQAKRGSDHQRPKADWRTGFLNGGTTGYFRVLGGAP